MKGEGKRGRWVRALAVVVALYPRDFRERLGRDLVDSFDSRLDRLRSRGRRVALVRFATFTLAAAVAGALAERVGALRANGSGRGEERGGEEMMHDFVRDVAHAWRQVRRRPGWAAVVVATLALGIGLNTAVFSVVRGVLLRPLPYAAPDRLVHLSGGGAASLANLEDLGDGMQSLEPVAGMFVPEYGTLTGPGDPTRVTVSFVTGDFFTLLGLKPSSGRWLGPEDDGTLRLVMSHALWAGRFGGDPSVVGRTVTLDDNTFEVVGVAPPDIGPPFEVDVWAALPWPAGAGPRVSRGWRSVEPYGRLAEGHDLDDVRVELEREWRNLQSAYPDENGRWRVEAVRLRDQVTADERAPLSTLFLSSLLLLAIACANVATVLLSRTETRRLELAVRASLGAGRWRLMRQEWTQGVVLGIVGGGMGVLLSVVAVDAFLGRFGASLSRVDEIRPDAAVLLFGFGASVATGIAAGAVSIVGASGLEPGAWLRRAAVNVVGRTGRLRRALVVSEIALALVLSVGLGLLVKSFQEVQRVDLGLQPGGVVTAQLGELPRSRYPDGVARGAFLDELLGAVETIAGVESAAVSNRLPLGGCCGNWAWHRGDDEEREERFVEVRWVSPSYFETLGVPLLVGRSFAEERAGDPGVAVVNSELARRLFDGADAALDGNVTDGRYDLRVVGVSAPVREYSPEREAPPALYLSTAQYPLSRPVLVLRSALAPGQVAPALREAVRGLDPQIPVEEIRLLDDVVRAHTADRRVTTFLMGVLGGLAVLLGAVGVYGVTSQAVQSRVRELGVRMALGATRRKVGKDVVGHALALVAPGVLLGAVGALAARPLVATLLYRVSPLDPVVYGTVVAVFVSVGVAASLGPARRAASVSPVDMMRDR